MLTSTLFCHFQAIFTPHSKLSRGEFKKVVNLYVCFIRLIYQAFSSPPYPQNYIPSQRKCMIITHCSKPNFDRQKPTLGKMYKTNSDSQLNFFLHCKKYFRLKSFSERLLILNHEAPTFFFFWDPLSKLGVTVEVRSFDGILLFFKLLVNEKVTQWKKGLF